MKSDWWKISLVSLGSLLVFWFPFWSHTKSFWGIRFGEKASMQTIVQNFDGLNFLIVAKTGYDPSKLTWFRSITGNKPIYFTAHYPGYALVIWLLDQFLTGPQAILASIGLANILLGISLLVFFQEIFKNEKKAFYLASLSLFLPARIMSVRAVGSTEPWFIAFSLLSIVFFLRKKPWLAGLMGAIAVLFRSPGILLLAGYGIYYLIKFRKNLGLFIKSALPYSTIAITLGGIWLFYGWRFGSFWAYFQSGDNLHLFWPPFQVFSNMTSWVSGMWLGDIIYIYLIFGIGLYLFWQKIKSRKELGVIGWWGIIYFGVILLVAHRDIARYSLPLAPVVLAGYGDYLWKLKHKWWLFWIVIPVFLWGWNFVLHNIQPVADWGVFI